MHTARRFRPHRSLTVAALTSGRLVRRGRAARRPGLLSGVLITSLCLLVLGAIAQAQQTDAVSREFTVFNDLTNPVSIKDAVSREFTVYNDLTNPVPIKDAVSREFSVFKGEAAPPITFTDAVSREFTAYNDLTNPVAVAIADAVTREFSVLNTIHCTGNLTDDGLVTLADISAFVDVLRGVLNDPIRRDAADVNCDGRADGLDVEPFVRRLLELS